jgi:hypothetical protein
MMPTVFDTTRLCVDGRDTVPCFGQGARTKVGENTTITTFKTSGAALRRQFWWLVERPCLVTKDGYRSARVII